LVYASPNIIRVNKPRRMRWVRHAVYMGEIRNPYKILVGNLKGRDHSEDLGIDEKISEWILGKQSGKVWTGCIWFTTGTSSGLL
jgi:hypothetical protein